MTYSALEPIYTNVIMNMDYNKNSRLRIFFSEIDIMKKRIEKKKILFIPVFLSCVLIIAALFYFTISNAKRIEEENREYLRDNATQIASVIDNTISEGYANIKILSDLVSDSLSGPSFDVSSIQGYVRDSVFDFIEFADKDGMDHNITGGVSDARDRKYYLDAKAGNSGMELIYISRATHETLLMFYSPIYYEDEFVGSLVGVYQAANKISEMLASNYFGEEAISYLTDDNGRIISGSHEYDPQSKMYITDLAHGDSKLESSIKAALASSETTVIPLPGNETGLCIVKLSNNEGYLVQIFPDEAGRKKIAEANVLGYEVVALLIVLFVFIFIVLRKYYRIQRKELNKSKEIAEESLTFTNFFLDSYISAYHISLNDSTYQIYKRTDVLDRNYPKVENFISSIEQYIECDVHPEDRAALLAIIQPQAIKKTLAEKSEFIHNFRDISDGTEKMYQMQVIRGIDENHVALGFKDITMEYKEQQKHMLGAIPLSSDILAKSNIGLWSFELDEGKAPRMYVDEAMLGLIGLDHQVTPEETYHAWYDNIDESSYDLVADAVEKMTAGERAEVQYPWHNPNGRTMIVRCGGVRNPEYKNGIRIEGTHQNVTEIIHFDEEEKELQRAKELELMHAEFRSSAMAFLNEQEGNIDSFLEFYATRLRELLQCDQVIYRSTNGDVFINNSPELGDDYHLPEEACQNCAFRDAHSSIYADGVAEVSDIKSGVNGIVAHKDCPVKSLLTRTISQNGEICGYLTMHYIRDYHEFSDRERQMMEEFANLLSLSLTQYNARKASTEMEHNLANQLRQIKSFGDMVNAALWSMDINEANEVIAVKWSNEFRHMLGYQQTEEDFPNTVEAWSSKLYSEDREITMNNFNNSITSRNYDGFAYDIEYRMIRKTGEICWYHAVGRMEDEGNGIRRMYGLFYDISADKQLAEALQKAEAANKAKTAFLFNMSHDIRTPMNAIVGFTNIAGKNLDDKEKLSDCIKKTQQASNLLLSLINSILEMSRIESGKAELEEAPGDFRYSFENIKVTMLELAKNKDIDLSFEIVDATDNYVYVDYDRMMRVFINIISNAIKYTSSGGWVKVKGEQIGRRDDGYGIYRYTIADNGIGMSEEFQKHVFDEFSREYNSTTNGIQGTGLGLSLVKSFVELMNGTVECKSTKGVGSIFTVTLPLRLQEEKENLKYTDPDTGLSLSLNAKDESISEVTFKGKRVLLVDDNELNREIAADILGDEGIVVEDADDGTKAVALLKEKGPDYYDFILMDIQMPLMNGYDATKAIRKMYPDAKLPIIALSANAFAEDKLASKEAGMNDHIAKPINLNELFDVLTKHMT